MSSINVARLPWSARASATYDRTNRVHHALAALNRSRTAQERTSANRATGGLPGRANLPRLLNIPNVPSMPDYLSSTDEEDIPVEKKPLFPVDDRPILGVAGGGVFFFWEVGVLKYLSERYRLQDVNLIGVSAGALASVLVACQVDFDRSVRRAYDICVERDIFNRPGGLQGVWGAILRQWLDDLLPENAHERCQGRVKIIATRMPRMKLCYLEEFQTRDDLIDSLLASVHIPFFLDGNGSFKYKDEAYIDGSIFDFFFGTCWGWFVATCLCLTVRKRSLPFARSLLASDRFSGTNSSLLTIDGRSEIIDYFYGMCEGSRVLSSSAGSLVLDPSADDQLEFSRLDFVKLLTLETVYELIRAGYSYAERTDAKGLFEEKLGSCRKSVARQAAEGLSRKLWAGIGVTGE